MNPNAIDVDVAVIGAGIVGSAIARELAGTRLTVALVEGRDDVGDGTSKANTAILHTGFDARPGTLESRLVARGYELLGAYAQVTGIPVERTGAVLVAWTEDELAALPALKAKAEANGYTACEAVSADEVYAAVPELGEGVLGGLTVPGESITCTWTTNLALATEAVQRGARLHRGHQVRSVGIEDDRTVLRTSKGDVRARWVVNAAGLGADHVDAMFGYDRFVVTPRRGELFVFDKLARPKAPKIVLPVPTSRGKGVLISPTIYGNVMLGPTSENLTDRTATGTSEDGFAFLLGKGARLMPTLLEEEVTASYAGLRAAIDAEDYLIELDHDQRYVVVGGIRSTGSHRRHGHRRARAGPAGRRRARTHDAGRAARAAAHAEHRRGRAQALPGSRPDRARRRLRHDRLLLRAGHGRRDPRRVRLDHPARRPRRTAAPHPRHERPLPGVLLRRERASAARLRRHDEHGRCRPGGGAVTSTRSPDLPVEHVRVAIVGGGPAGLTAAAELAPRIAGQVRVIERESEAGGIPRHSHHPGYGIRDLHRFISGPAYARRLTDAATDAGAQLQVQTQVTGWAGERRLLVTSPRGRTIIEADAVVLATGARERPRSALRIPGDRPDGVYTTGQLQNEVHLHHAAVGSRAVIVGAELVSWSAVLTLRAAGCRTVAMTSTYGHSEAYAAFRVAGRLALRTPVLTRSRVVRINGRGRVESVVVENLDSGARTTVACDTVVTSGNWIPDHELVRLGDMSMDTATLGPVVDDAFRTDTPGIFAIGNLVHPVDTADGAALDGRHVAAAVRAHLDRADDAAMSRSAQVRLVAAAPLRWVTPQLIAPGSLPSRGDLLLWTDRYRAFPVVRATQGGRVLKRMRLVWPAAPGRIFRVPAHLVDSALPTDEPVVIDLV